MLSSSNLLLGSTGDHIVPSALLLNSLITYSFSMSSMPSLLGLLSYVIKVTLLSSSSLLETRSNTSGSDPQAGSTLPNATNFVTPAGGSSDSVTIMSNVPSDFDGIPMFNYNQYCFYRYVGDPKREPECFDILWDLFEKALVYSKDSSNKVI